jgi:hypothetical protein
MSPLVSLLDGEESSQRLPVIIRFTEYYGKPSAARISSELNLTFAGIYWRVRIASTVFSALNRDFRYVCIECFSVVNQCMVTDVNGACMLSSLAMTWATKKSTEIAVIENEDLACCS